MKTFGSAQELITQVRADMGNRVIPELLTVTAATLRTKIAEGVAAKASASPFVGGRPDLADPKIYKIPPKAVILLIGRGSARDAAACTDVVTDVIDRHLKERSNFMRLLAQAGIK